MLIQLRAPVMLVVLVVRVVVALRYDADVAAPRLVAKGRGALAERIPAVARGHSVPIVRNPPLARAAWRH